MATAFPWTKDGAGWRAEMGGEVTLFATPERATGLFSEKPARGTKWHAGVSVWDESTRTISRYGRDVYMTLCDCAKDAKALAESVYIEESTS